MTAICSPISGFAGNNYAQNSAALMRRSNLFYKIAGGQNQLIQGFGQMIDSQWRF
jgi:hypothetical protein